MPTANKSSRNHAFTYTKLLGIDQSAWISGISFSTGWLIVGATDHLSVGWPVIAMALAMMAFFVCVMVIQRQMNFKMSSTTFGSPQTLVTGGVFKYSRNPIYLAFLMPLSALAAFSIIACLIAVAIYLLGMNLIVIPFEERELMKAFGSDFSNYENRTRRWI